MIGSFGAIAVIGLVIVNGAKAVFHVDLLSLLDNLPTVSMGIFLAGTVLISLLLLLLSMKISLAIMKKKEF